jgi:hypothetical protein
MYIRLTEKEVKKIIATHVGKEINRAIDEDEIYINVEDPGSLCEKFEAVVGLKD